MNLSTLTLPITPLAPSQHWEVQEVTNLEEFIGLCQRLERHHPTPFQHSAWLEHWYQSLAQPQTCSP